MSLELDRTTWTPMVFGDLVANINDYFDPARDGILPYVAGPQIDLGKSAVSDYGSTGDDDFPPTFKRKFRANDILLHSRNIDKLASVDRVGVTGEKLFVLRSKDDTVLLQTFLVWLLRSPEAQAHMRANFTGSVNKFLNWKPLATMRVDLPPLDEQKRIADLLWAVEHHHLNIEGLREKVRQASLELVERFLLNVSGPEVQLGDVLEIVRGGSPRPINDYFTEDPNGLNWIKIGDVPQEGKYVDSTAQRIKPSGLSKTRAVKPGDFILSNSMSFGRPYIVRIHGCIHDGWLSLSDARDLWHKEYLYQLLRSRMVQNQFHQSAGGSTVKNLNSDIVRRVTVKLPDLADQELLISQMDTATAADGEVAEELEVLRSLHASILAEVFGGN